jgi:hypothetical protein
MTEMRQQLASDRPGKKDGGGEAATITHPVAPSSEHDPQMRETAIDALAQLGVPRKQAAAHVDAVHGDTVEELVNHAFAHRQALKEGRKPPSTLRRHGAPPPIVPSQSASPTAPPAPVPVAQQQQGTPNLPRAPIGMLGPMAATPPSPAAAQVTALGGPPGGSQAAPSAQQLQAQTPAATQPGPRRNYYAEMIAGGAQPPAAPIQRLRDITVPRRQQQAPDIEQKLPRGWHWEQDEQGRTWTVGPGGERVIGKQLPFEEGQYTHPVQGGAGAQTPAPTEETELPAAPVGEGRKARVGLRVKQTKPAEEEEQPTESTKTQYSASSPIAIRTKAEWDKLKSGDHFVWTDGMIYKKD